MKTACSWIGISLAPNLLSIFSLGVPFGSAPTRSSGALFEFILEKPLFNVIQKGEYNVYKKVIHKDSNKTKKGS